MESERTTFGIVLVFGWTVSQYRVVTVIISTMAKPRSAPTGQHTDCFIDLINNAPCVNVVVCPLATNYNLSTYGYAPATTCAPFEAIDAFPKSIAITTSPCSRMRLAPACGKPQNSMFHVVGIFLTHESLCVITSYSPKPAVLPFEVPQVIFQR